jgi:predicted lipid carrier protein YhbT
VASVDECANALAGLADRLHQVDAELRAKHIPARTVACRVTDLDVTFVGTIDADGVHDIEQSGDSEPDADVRLSLDSDELLALADGRDDFVHAWLRGRLQVSASMRDLLRLRSIVGL